jgi:hypothetical protein
MTHTEIGRGEREGEKENDIQRMTERFIDKKRGEREGRK